MRVGFVLIFAILIATECVGTKTWKKGNEQNQSFATIKPTRLDSFISVPDAAVLFCKGGGHCSILKTMLNLVAEKPGNLENVKFGFYYAAEESAEIMKFYSCKENELAFFQNGKLHNKIPIGQLRTPSDVRSFIERSEHDLLPEVSNMADFEEQIRSCNGEYSTVVYFAPEKENEELEKFMLQLFLQYDNIFQFRSMRDSQLIYEAGEIANTVKVYQCYDHNLTKEFTHVVTDDFQSLKEWILHKGTPFVTKSSADTVKRAIDLFGLCVVVAIPETQEETVIDLLTGIAKSLNSVGFVWNYEKVLMGSFISSGATGNLFPTAIAMRSLDQIPIVWNEKNQFKEPYITQWIKDIQEEKEEIFKKSAPIPPASNAPLKPLVFDNFVQTVSSPSKATIVLFYDTHARCPDCYTAMHNMEKIATSSGKAHVSFYQYNVAENFLSQPVTRLPEIFLYKDDVVARFPDQAFSTRNIEQWLRSYLPKVRDEL